MDLNEDMRAIDWHPDHLGAGFVSTTLQLAPDDEGPVVATLTKHVVAADPHALADTPSDPHFAFLYLHGWNDYFYHPHLARQIARAGGICYALDLRKYGRSLRDHQTAGFITSLRTYDEDIHRALRVIRGECGFHFDLVLGGHSTGGLTAALWADRHPGALRALILNSPWLALQSSPVVKMIAQPIAGTVSRLNPMRILPVPDNGVYYRTLEELGWEFNPHWRRHPSPAIRAGWLAAIIAAHDRVAAGLEISCPTLMMTSARSDFRNDFTPELLQVDSVLSVPTLRRAALNLGQLVTLAAFEGAIHDVFLSAAPIRDAVFGELRRFLASYC
ncbi:MAG: alpha/beta hydrolase [Bowdeniella nasicola]|nr:alpha/beta hydrolase [Bowdeniella nasicola]